MAWDKAIGSPQHVVPAAHADGGQRLPSVHVMKQGLPALRRLERVDTRRKTPRWHFRQDAPATVAGRALRRSGNS